MSHQDRREPLPPDYQFPTHGVDCDCPTCRNRHVLPPLDDHAVQDVKDVVRSTFASKFQRAYDEYVSEAPRIGDVIRVKLPSTIHPAAVEEPTAETPWAI